MAKSDEVAEWLRRWTANPLGSPRVGSNPILVEWFFFWYSLNFNIKIFALFVYCVIPQFYTRDTSAMLGLGLW